MLSTNIDKQLTMMDDSEQMNKTVSQIQILLSF